jgi:hypothetical protein
MPYHPAVLESRFMSTEEYTWDASPKQRWRSVYFTFTKLTLSEPWKLKECGRIGAGLILNLILPVSFVRNLIMPLHLYEWDRKPIDGENYMRMFNEMIMIYFRLLYVDFPKRLNVCVIEGDTAKIWAASIPSMTAVSLLHDYGTLMSTSIVWCNLWHRTWS